MVKRVELKNKTRTMKEEIKTSDIETKPLGKPVHGKFLALMIKNEIMNGSQEEPEQ